MGLRPGHSRFAVVALLLSVRETRAESAPSSPAKPAAPSPAPASPASDSAPAAKPSGPSPAPSRSAAASPGEPSAALALGAVAAALRVAGFPESYQELGSLSARSRSAAVLPEVWIRALRSTDQQLRLTPTIDDPYRYTEGGGAGTSVEARLVWHLDRLVFSPDELAVQRLRADRADAAAKLRARVLETLLAWHRARAMRDDPNATSDEQRTAALDCIGARLTLDVLTGGWFTGAVEKLPAGTRGRE